MENECSYQSAREGWVYCIVNFRDREHVKIGMTTRPMEHRMKEANGTFTVDGFYIVVAKFVRNPYDREQTIHNILAEHRVSESREFFDVRSPAVFRRILQLFELMDGEVHADSKMRLDYAPRRARSATSSPDPNTTNKRVKLADFSKTFWELFRRTEDAKRTVAVDVVEQSMSERGFGDITVDMQNLGFYPYEDARRGVVVYRGLERAVGTLDFHAFAYAGDCDD